MFGLTAINSGLLWGTLLVASPIIIHLLNKRRFRIVDWAAMDFLIEANRQNRRRIQIEELILLILRCLAVVLLAMIVARLMLRPSGVLGKTVSSVRTERIIVLDDSPSMGARGARKSCFEEAKDGLASLMRGFGQERAGDSVTILTTSDPERPLINGQYVSADKAEEWAAMISRLELSDLPATYDKTLLTVEQWLASRTGHQNRAIYVVTDLRQRDWLAGGQAGKESPLTGVLKNIRPKVDAMAIFDLGGTRNSNLTITGISPADKSMVVGVPTRFEVAVRNFSDADMGDVEVTFTGGDAAPLRATLPSVKAGATASVPFTFTFRDPGSAAVSAEIGADDLPGDNARYFAADVREGVQVLVVDGEPSSEFGQAESFFLEQALSPPGDLRSGNILTIVTENQFETQALDQFQAVVLCNLYRLSEERIAALEAFVRAGGGLVFYLGDQVDEAAYTGRLYNGGQGLFPVKLAGIAGDETERQWAHVSPKAVNHPILRVFQGANNPFVSQVKLFRWWNSQMPEDPRSAVTVLASLTGAGAEPLIVEKPFGKGKVVAFLTSADGEWSTWPADPSYVVACLETVAYAARSTIGDRQLSLGAPLRHLLSVGKYEGQVVLTPPVKEKATQMRAAPSEDGKNLRVEFDDTRQRGFYRIAAARRDGRTDDIVYAANIDPEEGDLRRADPSELRRRLGDVQIDILSGIEQLRPASVGGSQGELWRGLLIALLAVLCVEQFLGWHFGRRR